LEPPSLKIHSTPSWYSWRGWCANERWASCHEI